jgi:hypothetical protein
MRALLSLTPPSLVVILTAAWRLDSPGSSEKHDHAQASSPEIGFHWFGVKLEKGEGSGKVPQLILI